MIYLPPPPKNAENSNVKKKGIILKVMMNVSLSFNYFDWEAVVFFLIFPIIISISVCVTIYKKKKGEISSPFKARVRINL